MVRGLESYAQRGRAALSGGESEDSAAEEGEASTIESASAVCSDGPDAGQRGDGQRVEERLLLFAGDDAHALWFRGRRGELRQEF